MATKLEKLLASIDSGKIAREIQTRTDRAIRSFMDPVQISSWESFKYYMLVLVDYLDENVPAFDPVYISVVGDAWARCVSLLEHIYGIEGDAVAFEIAKMEHEDGLRAIMKAIGSELAEEYGTNETTARIHCFWEGLSLAERVQAASEYISKYRRLLSPELTEGNIRMNFLEVLEKHPQLLQETCDVP